MTDHENQIEEFGKDDDFWLFGYGSVPFCPMPIPITHPKQKSHLETTATLRYFYYKP